MGLGLFVPGMFSGGQSKGNEEESSQDCHGMRCVAQEDVPHFLLCCQPSQAVQRPLLRPKPVSFSLNCS